MFGEIFDWTLLLIRWLHIIVGITWIGTSIFFMWLDRSFQKGELWMVHGGGFYQVKKLEMGSVEVPKELHWFKWESYWTWMSGMALLVLIFFSGGGTFLLDETISNISYWPAVGLSAFAIFGSWFIYDFLWDSNLTKNNPQIGHIFTVLWFMGMTYLLCHTLAGRAAYIMVGAMIGTWMTANVFNRIIPRQLQMVEAAKKGEPVNKEWGINAKNRSTHNTYLTLPIIFIMLSNHFPQTYGHEQNWLILILISLGGAGIREYFVARLNNPLRSKKAALIGIMAILIAVSQSTSESHSEPIQKAPKELEQASVVPETKQELPETVPPVEQKLVTLSGEITLKGAPPEGKKLRLPSACSKHFGGKAVYSNEVMAKNGKLQNVIVWIKSGLTKKYTNVPSEPAVLDQLGCIYKPRTLVVRANQKLKILNSDPIFHNVKMIANNNKRFNIAMPKKGQVLEKVFPTTEVAMSSKCSLHPWMGANVAVVDHPFFFVTKADGKFEIKNLPTGKYTLEIWHEIYGSEIRSIDVKNDLVINHQWEVK